MAAERAPARARLAVLRSHIDVDGDEPAAAGAAGAQRIAPIRKEEWAAEIRDALPQKKPGLVFQTLAQHPKLLKRWLPWSTYVVYKSTLTKAPDLTRLRNLALARLGWLKGCEYTFGAYATMGKFSAKECAAVCSGAGDAMWAEREAVAIRVADEVHMDACVSDETWAALTRLLPDLLQRVDLIGAVAHYTLNSMMLNSFGVGLDKGLKKVIPPNFARDSGVPAPLIATGSRPSAARVPPLPVPQWDAELAKKLNAAKAPPLNVQKTLANHPKLLGKWVLWANHVLFKNSNTPRVREIAILRAGWNSRSMYEWNQHVRVGKGVGMTDADMAAIGRGPEDAYWDGKPAVERLALRVADELRTRCNVSDATWAALASVGLSDHQRMDLVAAVGQYSMVSIFLNTFGVELDKGMKPVPFHP